MSSTFSPSLRIELIGDGDQSGIWGQTTNTNLGTLVEQAITGVVTIDMADTNYVMSNFNGVSDESRNQVIVLIGTNTAARNLVAPLVEKTYVIKNSTTGGFAVQIIGASGTGVTIPNGVTTSVYCDGTNFYTNLTGATGNFTVAGNLGVTGTTALTGTLTANNVSITTGLTGNNAAFTGTVTVPTQTAGTANTTAATTAFVGAAITAQGLGTMSTQNANNVSITGGTITGITDLAVADGGTGASTFTANNVVLGNGTSSLAGNLVAPGTSGNVLTSNGTTWVSTPLNSSGLAKAWVSFDSSGTILKAFNVASITVRGTGQWTINFTTALSDGNYVMAGNCAYGPTYVNSGGVLISFNWDGSNGVAPTSSSCQINTARLTYNGSDAEYFSPALTTVVFFD